MEKYHFISANDLFSFKLKRLIELKKIRNRIMLFFENHGEMIDMLTRILQKEKNLKMLAK